MKKLFFLLLFLPVGVLAHPGIALVKDSKGNIYYSDLTQVWKITNGKKTIVVSGVHTHELYIDNKDNLYGEHVSYSGEATDKYYHYLWRLKPGNILDTIFDKTQAYLFDDYSLARDKAGFEYYLKLKDSLHIYKKSPDGKESVFSSGNFNGVSWLHPQKDGSLLYVLRNSVFRIKKGGEISTIATNIASKPTFSISENNKTPWGVWENDSGNVYVAVLSDQVVKKISANGSISIYYTSPDNWTPLQGVFDNNGQLWVLEYTDKNEIRAVLAGITEKSTRNKKFSLSPVLLIIIIVMAIVVTKRILIKNPAW